MTDKIKQEFQLKSRNNNRPFLADLTLNPKFSQQPIILFVHGFKGFKDWGHFDLLANYFADNGFAFLKFNFSHNGTTVDDPHNFGDLEAFGQNNFTKELHDIDLMIDFIQNELAQKYPVDADKIVLIGHSRGGGIAIVKTSLDNRIKALITWAAVNNFKMGLTEEKKAYWKKMGTIYVDNARTNQKMPLHYQLLEDVQNHIDIYHPLNAISNITKPVLIIHGDQDETVPVTHAKELALALPHAKLHIISEANHVFGGSHPFKMADLHPHTFEVFNKSLSFLNEINY